MTAVTERFVVRFSATAQGYAVPDFIDMTIRRFNRNTATHPERAMFTPWGILNDHDGFFKFGFKCLSGLFIPDNKAPGRTVSCLFNRNFPGLTIA